MTLRRLLISCLCASACIVSIAQPASAQTVPIKSLAKPDAELKESFTSVVNVRELSDGRVIVSDSRDKSVQLADFRRQTITKIGREGAGPGEYKSPARLYALRGDTTLLRDFANSRFLVITGDGKAIATRPYDVGPVNSSSNLIGIDELGRMYLSVRAPDTKEEGGTQTVVRYTPTTKHVDTITTITLPLGRFSGAMMLGGGMLKVFSNLPLSPEDVADVSLDGRVAVARPADYHVEWNAGAGRRVAGTPVAYEPIAITPKEKRAHLESQIRPGSIIVQNNPGSKQGRNASESGIPKSALSPEALDDTGMQWPQRKPPFLASSTSVDGDGRLWIRRTTTYDDSIPRYDVFNAGAKLIMRVVLPAKSALVGFGNKTVYLTRSDDDDLKILQRFALPQ